jgi:nicotinamide-nucleotide amidase
MNVELISIGEELLSGFILNGNAAYIGRVLDEINIGVDYISTVGDMVDIIVDALETAANRAAVIIATGGLGPTSDDVTLKAAAQFFNRKLVFHDEVMKSITKKFKIRGKSMPSENRKQAELPEGALVIPNSIGTAPGVRFKYKGSVFFFLPGVPSEMQEMMRKEVLPFLENNYPAQTGKQKIIRTTGISESEVASQAEEVRKQFPQICIAYLPQVSGVQIKLKVRESTPEKAEMIISQAEEQLREKLGNYIYGRGNESMEEVVAQLLFAKKLTIAVAESCTGGLISHKLTNIPGSSAYFKRGFITYSNTAKMELLGVAEKTLEKYGAVSSETAAEMAIGVRRVSRTDIGLSATGIAGPGGGTREKPVGLVYLGCSLKDYIITEKYRFFRDRIWNKERTAVYGLDLLRRVLSGKPDARN